MKSRRGRRCGSNEPPRDVYSYKHSLSNLHCRIIIIRSAAAASISSVPTADQSACFLHDLTLSRLQWFARTIRAFHNNLVT